LRPKFQSIPHQHQINTTQKHETQRVYDTHEPIVSKEDFELANSLVLKDLRISPGQEAIFTFSGIARCADCGMNMIRAELTRCSADDIIA